MECAIEKMDKAVECEGECQYWYHYMCMEIDNDVYDHLSVSEEPWICSTCKKYAPFNTVNRMGVFH